MTFAQRIYRDKLMSMGLSKEQASLLAEKHVRPVTYTELYEIDHQRQRLHARWLQLEGLANAPGRGPRFGADLAQIKVLLTFMCDIVRQETL